MLEQNHAPLLKAVQAYLKVDHAAFYMPGHKRGRSIDREFQQLLGENLFRLDLPELPGLDLAIASAEKLAADAYGSDRTWFLVNGSTCGIQAMMLSVCQPGDKILLGRNCHKAAIAALVLSGAEPVYLETKYDPRFDLDCGVIPDTLEAALVKHPDAKAVMLVSPNYFGVCADLESMIAIAHAHKIPVLVDEAHGAHLHFHPNLPISAIAAGADLVVQSTHKLISGLTQTSMLHCQGDLVDAVRVSQALQILQTSSLNLILLTALDVARRQMVLHGKALLETTIQLADTARSQINSIPGLYSFSADDIPRLDPTRLTVMVSQLGTTGFAVDQILYRELEVMAEMPTLSQVVFAISIGNSKSDIDKLVQAFSEVSSKVSSDRQKTTKTTKTSELLTINHYLPATQKLTPRAAFFAQSDRVSLADAIGRISTEMLCPYPPGIPIICPGEEIRSEVVELLKLVQTAGGVINGGSDPTLETISVVRQ
jgi:arginine decarboxylase